LYQLLGILGGHYHFDLDPPDESRIRDL